MCSYQPAEEQYKKSQPDKANATNPTESVNQAKIS